MNKNPNSADVRHLTRATTKAQRKRLSTSKVFNLAYLSTFAKSLYICGKEGKFESTCFLGMVVKAS